MSCTARTLEGDKSPLQTSLCTAEIPGFRKGASPARAMAFISEGSLGLRCSLRLDTEEDFPRLKKERQLPTGDFFILLGGLFLGRENGTHGWRGSCSSVLAACHQHSLLSAQKLLVSAWKLPLFHSRGCFHSSSSALKSCWVNSPSLCKAAAVQVRKGSSLSSPAAKGWILWKKPQLSGKLGSHKGVQKHLSILL